MGRSLCQLLLASALSLSTILQAQAKKPNILFVLTDDQDWHMQSLDYMPLLQKYLVNEGTLFDKHYCTVAVCCPSRVNLWTGMTAHNVGAFHKYLRILRVDIHARPTSPTFIHHLEAILSSLKSNSTIIGSRSTSRTRAITLTTLGSSSTTIPLITTTPLQSMDSTAPISC